jgi:hypothetical protein
MENGVLEAEKAKLSAEVRGLTAAHAKAKNLRKEEGLLKMQVEDAKGAEALAIERALKANKTADNL